jgi:hypothetical protein
MHFGKLNQRKTTFQREIRINTIPAFWNSSLGRSTKIPCLRNNFSKGTAPTITLKCIDYTEYQSHESWLNSESRFIRISNRYQDLNYELLKNGSEKNDLKTDCTQADFRSVASTFHNEFFGEHPDNVLS